MDQFPLFYFMKRQKKKFALNESEWVDGTEKLKVALEKIIGKENVVIQKKEQNTIF